MTDGPLRDVNLPTEGSAFLSGGGRMGRAMREKNWSATPLGPVEDWPQSLRSAISICLGANYPIAIYWGPQLTLLYNDAWSPIPGEKHPWALGRPGREVWPEIWDRIGPLYEQVQESGEGVWQQDQLLPMKRHGYTEECYFNFTFSPVRGEDGQVEGIFNAVVETTFRVIGERRERFLRELAEQLSLARSEEEIFSNAETYLGVDADDLPFGIFYRLDDRAARVDLVGVAGLPADHSANPQAISLSDPNPTWPFLASLEQGPQLVSNLDQRFSHPMPGGSWPESATEALVVPIEPAGSATTGFFIAGVSPRRELDITIARLL